MIGSPLLQFRMQWLNEDCCIEVVLKDMKRMFDDGLTCVPQPPGACANLINKSGEQQLEEVKIEEKKLFPPIMQTIFIFNFNF